MVPINYEEDDDVFSNDDTVNDQNSDAADISHTQQRLLVKNSVIDDDHLSALPEEDSDSEHSNDNLKV